MGDASVVRPTRLDGASYGAGGGIANGSNDLFQYRSTEEPISERL